MNKRYGRKCPYCNKKIGYFYTVFHLRDGEYTCNECKKYSNVKYNPLIYLFLIIAALLGCVFGFILFENSLTGVILSLLPFLCIYLSLPLFYMLVPIKLKPKNSSDNNIVNNSRVNVNNNDSVKKYIPKKKQKYKELDIYEINEDLEDGSTKYIPDIK